MTQKQRILVGGLILTVLVGLILGGEALRRRAALVEGLEGFDTPPVGSIPISLNGEILAYFTPDDLVSLELVGFVDAEEGKPQEGWLLRDVLLLALDDTFAEGCSIVVSSSSREKTAEITWAEVTDESNMIMLDLSGRGTLKLISLLDQLDVRDEWVQDVNSIELVCP